MKSLANEFFVTMADGARKHQAEHSGDYELIVNGIKDESDLAQQVALVEQMVASGVRRDRRRARRFARARAVAAQGAEGTAWWW